MEANLDSRGVADWSEEIRTQPGGVPAAIQGQVRSTPVTTQRAVLESTSLNTTLTAE